MALDWDALDVAAFENDREDNPTNRVQKMLEESPGVELPADLTDLELWENYCDEELYLLEKKLREYFKAMMSRSVAKGGYRTSCQLVFVWMFGHKPDPKTDGPICKKLNRLLNFYAYEVTGNSQIAGKKFPKTYKISKYGTFGRRPLSVKLRMELNNIERGTESNARTFVHLRTEESKPITKRRSSGNGSDNQQREDA